MIRANGLALSVLLLLPEGAANVPTRHVMDAPATRGHPEHAPPASPQRAGVAAPAVNGHRVSRTALTAGRRPNVVIVMLDDAGFADLGAFGSSINTPNIDRLAMEGLRYTNFHTTGLCSPSRAALLTGRNHHTVGMRTIANFATTDENNLGRITPGAATLAEILRSTGYNTLAVGKWHLVPLHETTPAGPFDNWPLGKGFERYYGFLDGGTNQWLPELVSDNHHVEPPKRDGYHLTEDLVDHAIEFVREQQSARPDKPFFLYLTLAAPHAPHQAPKEFIDRYAGRFSRGWDQERIDRLARMKQMGIVPNATELGPSNPGVQAWTSLTADDRRVFERFQESYAGFVEHTDTHLGRLFDFLREIGTLDSTVVFLMSDNGASQEGGLLGTTNILSGANGVPMNMASNLAAIDGIGGHLHTNYPLGWAQASNTPFKRYKQNVHFGGVRDPLIVRWPAGIADRGGIRPQFSHLIDIAPTVLEILGEQAPTRVNGVRQLPLAGVSMRSSFASAAAPPRHVTQYFEMYGHRGIYHDGWKAVTYHVKGTPFERDVWELYHVAVDFSEAHDLAAQQPAKLREMIARWGREAARYGVLPLDDRTLELRSAPKRGAPDARSTFTYYAGTTYINTNAAPDTKNRSYSITAEVNRPSGTEDGVLLAHGDETSGWTLYIRDGHLVHEYNYLGEMMRVVSDVVVPTGRSTLRYVFTKAGELRGTGTLFVNGQPAGEVAMPRTLPNVVSYEGLSVGRDALSPVSPQYAAMGEYSFRGAIARVTVELGSRQ